MKIFSLDDNYHMITSGIVVIIKHFLLMYGFIGIEYHISSVCQNVYCSHTKIFNIISSLFTYASIHELILTEFDVNLTYHGIHGLNLPRPIVTKFCFIICDVYFKVEAGY